MKKLKLIDEEVVDGVYVKVFIFVLLSFLLNIVDFDNVVSGFSEVIYSFICVKELWLFG